MTSLTFFPQGDFLKSTPPSWGTGRSGAQDLWIPRAPTWHGTGLPSDNHYQTTSLKLSNVRANDELVPRPQSVDISKLCINKPFPAEHPYNSHIEKFAIIPSFVSPQDPKKGADRSKPISSEMPANPYDTILVKKVKGFPYREEKLCLTSDGNKNPLHWVGENYFDQQSKVHGNKQVYYPTPIKQIAPNLQDRPPELQVSQRTQNALRNVERNQWITKHQMDFTGLGPSNPMALDNLDCKNSRSLLTGELDEKLYPCTLNTFDPARPLEGRMRRLFAPKSAQQIYFERGFSAEPSTPRKMTISEIEEDRLLHGKDYVNLPESYNAAVENTTWHCSNVNNQQSSNAEDVQEEQQAANTAAYEEGYVDYLTGQKETMDRKIQQMEASSRWKLLENGTPAHDIIQLREKFKILKDKEMPSTFYKHEGKYNEERALLYKTSYDPHQLAYSMNSQQLSGGTLFNTSMSHVDASKYPTVFWEETDAALKQSSTVVFRNNELSGDRPSTDDMLLPYRETVAIQRSMLQPNAVTASPRVQEGGFTLKETTYGDNHNAHKFLQDNRLDITARLDPSYLMSHENQNLERTRERATPILPSIKGSGSLKSVHFSDDVQIRNIMDNIPVKVEDTVVKPLSKDEQCELERLYGHHDPTSLAFDQSKPPAPMSGMTGDARNLAENLLGKPHVPTVVDRNVTLALKPSFVSFTRNKQRKVTPVSEMADEFRSLSTNFLPQGCQTAPTARSCYASQFPYYDLGEKKDKRFDWQPGKGHLRPQTCLSELQDSFIKSEVRRRFHHQFPETNPDLRVNITTGKKHVFFGMNAQVIRG
ncbi:uncharacterized protein LOC131954646 [Physella acuta]|uniref:uncharacterized protein LOC131954646 n=1 Tax=Physella acuta TaxID=109671 RepID=UPI0027DCF244|nr:uncharacterized protein LOC131954646 [Physella acuta]